MTISLSVPEQVELKPRITVFGVGGAGGNAVNNMIEARLEGVEFVVANTDAQALSQNKAPRKIQLGSAITQGLGAGSKPEVGRAAAEETLDQIMDAFAGSHMVFITAGMGGGTGTGAAPVVARAAREQGMLTVGVVTKPFQFEGAHRAAVAERGIAELQQYVDTLIIIPNQNLFRLANEKTTFAQAFAMADNVLHSGVRGVTDLMIMPGLINLDFADVRTVMSEMGKAMMGTGEASGEKRAIDAAEAAISNPLLDDVSMKGARGVLINITGGMDLTLFEVDEAANRIRSEVDPDANIIVGSTFDPEMDGRMRVSVVATGIEAPAQSMPKPAQPAIAPFVRPPQAGPAAPTASPAPAPAPMVRQQPVNQQPASQPMMGGSPMPQASQPAPVTFAQQSPQMDAHARQIELMPAPMPQQMMPQHQPPQYPPPPQLQPQNRQPLAAPPPLRDPEPAPRRGGLLDRLAKNMLGMRSAPQPAAPAPQVQLRSGHVDPHSAFSPPQNTMQAPHYNAPQQGVPQQGVPQHGMPQHGVQAPQGMVYDQQPVGTATATAAATQPQQRPALPPQPQPQPPFESVERPSGSRNLDDQLEIPAFLRRQAN